MESEAYVSPILAAASILAVFTALVGLMFAELPAAARLRDLIYAHAQKGMLAVALVATGSSLYYSEVVGFIPCEFCWYQRIIMYSLALLLLVATVTRARLDARYIVALAVVGLSLSIYHYQLQLFPEQGGICSATVVHCTDRNVDAFGFVSIPFMAGAGFLSILLLQIAVWRSEVLYRRWDAPDASPESPGVAGSRSLAHS
ncbi:MAG: disulfide bond formation protein B [Hyphomicrobiales bacterium]